MQSIGDRKRRLVTEEAATTALRIFGERGYEATSIDELAAALGMSRRTFFRYFRSKEEVAVAKWRAFGEEFLARLAQRPDSEHPWTSLRRALDHVVAHYDEPDRRADSYALDETVANTPALHSAFLDQIDQLCLEAAAILQERGASDLTAAMWARCAGAALTSAMDHARTRNEPGIRDALDEAFSTVGTSPIRTAP